MILGFGLCFELPLFLVMLNLVGIITHERFRKWRRIMIFLVFVFAGIASPSPDPVTMLLLGGVVCALVEVAESSSASTTGAGPGYRPTVRRPGRRRAFPDRP